MKNLYNLALAALVAVACSCNNPVNTKTINNDYQVPDAQAIGNAVNSTYHSFSYKRGVNLDTPGIRAQFTPEARIIIFDSKSMQNLSVTQFLNFMTNLMKGQGLDSFENIETGGRTEEFGHLAHRISSFKLYLNTRDTVAERGVASFQLIKLKDAWKVSSMVWVCRILHAMYMCRPTI